MYGKCAACVVLALTGLLRADAPAAEPANGAEPPLVKFTARFTVDELRSFVELQTGALPLPMRLESQKVAIVDALDRISMGALIQELQPFLTDRFPGQFDTRRDLIVVPVPEEQQVTIETPELERTSLKGPSEEVIGFLVHDITELDFLSVAIRVIQTARQLLDTRNPVYDRSDPDHFRTLMKLEADRLRSADRQAEATQAQREEVRRRIGQALGIYDPETDTFEGAPEWAKESRRFSYIIRVIKEEDVIKGGEFISRLKPMVDRFNRDLEMAGFPPPPPALRAGIHFDPDLGDVEIVLPKPMMSTFLDQADRLEQRMAQEDIISIEAVRLTDRDIINGALAARIGVLSQGVHDINRFNERGVLRQLGLNTLLAVANQQIQVNTLRAIEAGDLPGGVSPISIARPELPPLQTARSATTIGSDFSMGADDIFFDGRQQTYGFSYITPDGIEHTLALEVVDSLREFWDRIERNLIVHKIKKLPNETDFTVPVGPHTRTFGGIAALISQENQQLIVATGVGAISEISASAGTWLIIQDFDISPLPGSSTALTDEEQRIISDRVLMTMLLRDAMTSSEDKRALLATMSREELREQLAFLYESKAHRQIRPGRTSKTYRSIYEKRYQEAIEDATVEKRELNSSISLSFYSSQGNIIQVPGTTQLGDANDLTSFTTELRPNVVTPISSFFTKSGTGARGTSPLTGVAKGEQANEEKTMTHLIVRARFPTVDRERHDRDEARHMGYFEIPISRDPASEVDPPFLSSSEHPMERLASFRVGFMFDALQRDRVRRPLNIMNPNALMGTVSHSVWETATTRMMMNRKIITDSPGADQALGDHYTQRFMVEVRSLIEYDEDFYGAPNLALRNMAQWNNPERIVLALNNSPGKFALLRFIELADELGERLLPDDYADGFLAQAPPRLVGGHRIYPLSGEELRALRRDVAIHYLRLQEACGDAFLEAASIVLGLGTYRGNSRDAMLAGPLRGYHDLVLFDLGGRSFSDPESFEEAHHQFMLIKQGGYRGRMFEPSLETIEDLPREHRRFIMRGREILQELGN